MPSKHILMVDSGWTAAELCQLLIAKGYLASHCGSMRKFLKFITSPTFTPSIVVLNQFMNCELPELREETANSTLTGVLLYNKFRESYPEIPVIMLYDESLGDRLKESATLRLIPIDQCPPETLIRMIEVMTGK